MRFIFSPWRMKYIQSHKRTDGCVFCEALTHEDGPDNLILYRGEKSFVILNRFPYTSGHLMVLPYEHTSHFEDLDAPTRHEIMDLLSRTSAVLRAVYHPNGMNIGANLGVAAGAGVADHVHFHIVPRWSGDSNFMSTVGGTRVLPETLDETFARIKAAWR